MKIAIKVNRVSKTFKVRTVNKSITERVKSIFGRSNIKEIKALKDLNFEVYKGEIFGIIGKNGSGKSTLINLLMGNIKADSGGVIKLMGRPIRLSLGLGVDPNLTGRENIFVNGSIIGLTFRNINSLFNSIISFAEIEGYEDIAMKYYSKGMRSRLLFSVAVHANADIFLLDEFFGGVGDEVFKKKSDELFQNNIVEKKTIILVSHNLGQVKKYCDRVLLLNSGKQVFIGNPKEAIKIYKSTC